MAYDLDIRFRCRASYEIYGKNLNNVVRNSSKFALK